MTGVAAFPSPSLARTPHNQESHSLAAASYVADNLQTTLAGLAHHLFGNVESRWVNTTFPFTHPSYELEIKFGGQWLEVLGCGVVEQRIVNEARGPDKYIGWAFGLG